MGMEVCVMNYKELYDALCDNNDYDLELYDEEYDEEECEDNWEPSRYDPACRP